MKKFSFKINGQSFDVNVQDFEGKTTVVSVNGTDYEVELDQEVQQPKTPKLVRKAVVNKPGEGTIKKTASSGGYKIKAPLPGSIFKLNCAVGDTIKEGQCLLIMEAMKMENNVLSDKAGTISAIKVNVGDTVLQDDVLIEIA
ncbi:acetyl-CoA carboxylase biotin carboxyl carrier protein subunit [Marinilabiliaceae bacterium JC040]|nr:acetyl-CoA carboxylase biotin carboxyl carrier protein subunit [Marinilabiliaceae bacterium JC040]